VVEMLPARAAAEDEESRRRDRARLQAAQDQGPDSTRGRGYGDGRRRRAAAWWPERKDAVLEAEVALSRSASGPTARGWADVGIELARGGFVAATTTSARTSGRVLHRRRDGQAALAPRGVVPGQSSPPRHRGVETRPIDYLARAALHLLPAAGASWAIRRRSTPAGARGADRRFPFLPTARRWAGRRDGFVRSWPTRTAARSWAPTCRSRGDRAAARAGARRTWS